MPLSLPDPQNKEATDRRRIEALTISGDVLLGFLFALSQPGSMVYLPAEQLPPDARCVGLDFDHATNSVRLYVHSMTFDPVDDAVIPPDLSLSLGRIYFPYVSRDGTPYQGDVLKFLTTMRENGRLLTIGTPDDQPTNA